MALVSVWTYFLTRLSKLVYSNFIELLIFDNQLFLINNEKAKIEQSFEFRSKEQFHF